jgi:YspA, cpYpsA-related SLOG family
MRVLVCGDRNWTDGDVIETVLDGLLDQVIGMEKLFVVEGCAKGADSFACQWYDGKEGRPFYDNVIHEHFPAQWGKYGKAAGPKRNKQMIDSGIDLVVAFHNDIDKSKGTSHTLTLAAVNRIPVWLVRSWNNK